MKVLITGGAGFLGRRLARGLLERGCLLGPGGEARPIGEILLLDVVAAEGYDDPRVRAIAGDIAAPGVLRAAIDPDTHAVFHLAAIVSGQAEEDFELGMRVNLDASRELLEACRSAGHAPRVVFTSSVAVYGGSLPDVVLDATALNPRSSYGAQKAIAELLLGDYTRRGWVDGRVLRLPTVSVRPGRPNRAASSFASGIIREPLNGEDAICPVDPATRLWLLSPRRAVECLIHGHEIDGALLGDSRAVNLPGVSVTVAQMLVALESIAGAAAVRSVRFERDPVVERIVGSWPGAWDASRALRLGFRGDADFGEIVRAYMEDDLGKPA